MKRFAFRAVTIVVTACFGFYCIGGCGSSEAMKRLTKYEGRGYTDVMVIRGAVDDVYKASVAALQTEEFNVTLSDPQTGLLSAEKYSASVIPEDQKALDDAKEPASVWAIVIGVLAIILVVGLIAILVSSCNETDKEGSQKSKDKESTTTAVVVPPPQTVTGYKYIVSLTLARVASDSTEIDITATKMFVENGVVTSSAPMRSKYLNYIIFDAIYEQTQALR